MRQDPHSGTGCECIYLRMRLVPGRVSGAVVEGRARVGGHPASDASVGLRPVVAFVSVCILSVARISVRVIALAVAWRVVVFAGRGPKGVPGARCLLAWGLSSGRYGCRGRAIRLD